MTTVAVVAHAGKSFGGGLDELRAILRREGVHEPLWFEVPKSKKAPAAAAAALDQGADLVFVWGGDGTVQRCLGELAGRPVDVAVLPAGTANLLATNLGIPVELEAAVRTGLHGRRRAIDVGTFNGERFAVEGESWMDREWGTSALGPERSGWDWFGLQLDDGVSRLYVVPDVEPANAQASVIGCAQ